MKTLHFFFFIACLPLQAQTNFPPAGVKLTVLPKSSQTWMGPRLWREFVKYAFVNGVRQWGNEVVDLRPAQADFETGRHENHGFSLLAGKVLSVGADGLLITLETEVGYKPQTVWLYRAPFLGKVVDGDPIAAIGRKMPPYSYQSATGARRTVEAFDCGEAPDRRYLEYFDALAKAEADAQAESRKRAAQAAADTQAEAKRLRQAEADARVFAAWKKRAEAGDPAATYEMGCCYLQGRGVGKDESEGLRLITKAAEAGHPAAKNFIKGKP